MRRLIKGGLSGILVVLLVVTMVPTVAFAETGAQDAQQVSSRQISQTQAGDSKAQRATAAVEKFTDAISKFMPLGKDVSKLTQFMTRFGGVTNIASGVVGILQMAGIIQDPVMTKLGEVLNTVRSMEDQLKIMDKKLDGINQELVSMQVQAEEKERNDKAIARMKDWREFVRDYCEPLNDSINEYEGFIEKGINSWWKSESHSGVNVIYSKTNDGIELNYSTEEYSNGKLPAEADNGDAVEVNSSYAVPGNIIPNTAKMKYNVNTYRANFETQMAANFVKAADGKQLKANNAFFTAWNKLSTADKNKKAKQYASDILNTIIYQISCDVMSENNNWVIKVTNQFSNYCKNMLIEDSGINARIQAMTLTHGFEGEIKKDLEEFCDAMVAQAGLYGTFALTCVGQSDLQSLKNREKVQDMFVDTIIELDEKYEATITHHDNYCYVTHTLVEQDTVQANSTIAVTMAHSYGCSYRGFNASDWTITLPNILNDVYSQVLFHQYQSLNQDAKTFAEYLSKYGAVKDKDFTGPVMTNYLGAEVFPLDDAIEMKAKRFDYREYYFKNGQINKVEADNISKVEREYFYLHDRVKVNEMNLGTGAMNWNKMVGARAFYGEAHTLWDYDEPWVFYTDNNIYKKLNYTHDGEKCIWNNQYTITLPVLKLTAVQELNGEEQPDNPLFAFDRSLFIEGISDWIGDVKKPDEIHITSVKLDKTNYKYTGKDIKPKVTVKAGKNVVPAEDYTVEYVDNKAIGQGHVIVNCKDTSKYAGTISTSFDIVSDTGKKATANTEAKMVAKGKNAMKISWPVVKLADGYDVFFARCNHGGKTNKYKKVKTINSNKKLSYTKTGLKKGASYKAKVKAFVKVEGKKKYISTSPTMHAYAGGGTKHYTNAKSVKVKKTNVTLKKGKTYKIKATVTKLQKNKKLMPSSHKAKLRYRSTNKKVATVNRYGKIKAKAKGKCTICVFAHNGVGKLVHVTVK